MAHRNLYRVTELMKNKYNNRIIVESEEFPNVWYEMHGNKTLSISALIDGKHIILPGSMDDMKRLIDELTEIIEVYDI